MRRTIPLALLGLIIALNFHLIAQVPAQDIGKQYFEMGEFFRWGHDFKGIGDQAKAVIAYQKSADLNYPDGIMALGEMYQEGRGGLQKDVQKGFDLFTKAYKMGSGRACYNLGKSYAYGLGCEVDYAKMISYLNDGIRKGDPASLHGMGNMLYKGWGVEQSYEKSIVFFEKAALLGNATSHYYLGLCYLNGYGVAKNEQKGKEYLQKATLMYPFALKELKKTEPEINRLKKIKKKEFGSPENHSKIKHNAKIESFTGNWIGHITQYDWSGKFKLEEESIELNIKTHGDIFEGSGILKGEPISIKGFDNQYGVEFSSGEFDYFDHFMGKVKLRINTGSFESFTQGQKSILAGNITLFSITENSPGRPAHMVLTRKVEEKLPDKDKEMAPKMKNAMIPSNSEESNLQAAKPSNPSNIVLIVPENIQSREEQIVDHLHNNIINSRAWPNPFKNQLSVEYNLLTDGEIEIRLISIDGKLMGILSKEKRMAGLQIQQFEVAVPNGTYVLQLISNNMKASHKVVKY